jgi:hypothetical protein
MEELADRARQVIDTNRYMALGTTEADHRPRVSPVYFTHDRYRDFYWVSSPEARHSVNVAARPDVAIVIFDSTVPVGGGKAVYVTARAARVPDGELAAGCAAAYGGAAPGEVAFTPEELSGEADLRLYRARATSHEVHVRGGDPDYGTGIDTRRPVSL